MSALNHTAPRFRSQNAVQLPVTGPAGGVGGGSNSASSLPFAQALDVPPRLVATSLLSPTTTPLATPLAPPPPPPVHLSSSQSSRHSVRYAGVDHTLGPVFSEEEDGDDSDFIAAKMASLGIDPHRGVGNGGSQYNAGAELQRRIRAQQMLQLQILTQQQQLEQERQHQQQQQQAAAQAAIQHLMLHSNDPQQLREARALLELQRAQLANSTNIERMYQQVQYPLLNQQRIQMQQQLMALQLQSQQQVAVALGQDRGNLHGHGHSRSFSHGGSHSHTSHAPRHNLAAQLEAGTLRREREREQRMRPMSPENTQMSHSRMRAAFESAPGGYFPPFSPPVDSAAGVGWTSTLKSPASEWPTSAWTVTSASQRSSSSGSNNSASARAPSPPTPAPVSASAPTASVPPAPSTAQSSQPLGRFARARQDIAAAQAAAPGTAPLAALLSRRRPQVQTEDDTVSSSSSFPDTVATSPLSESYHGKPQEREWESSQQRKVASESGHTMLKDPASYSEWGFRLPAPRSQSFSATHTPDERAVAYVVRQPYGPPGSPDDLKTKNFATSIRRQAGLNLGMLNRRTGHDSTEA